jgi:hypothetical protein
MRKERRTMISSKMVVATMAALSTGAPARSQSAPSLAYGSVQGTVLDENGRPLGGATVFARPEQDMFKEIRATSDAKGNFVLADVPVGGVYVDAFKESDGYPYNAFAFYKPIGETTLKVKVEPLMQTQDIAIKLGPKAATLHLEITPADGGPLFTGAELEFTRDDIPSPYSVRARPHHTMFVPSFVPFRFSATVPGYKQWNSQLITAQPGETLNIAVHLERQ